MLLEMAVSLGQYHQLDREVAVESELDKEERSHWLRVWETSKVLYR